MVLAALQTAKRLAKHQVTDDVERRPVVPLVHVQQRRLPLLPHLLCCCRHALVHAPQQQVDVGAQDGLLTAQRRVGEALGQRAAQLRVLGELGVVDRVRLVVGGGAEGAHLAQLRPQAGAVDSAISAAAAGQRPVDVAPCAWVREGEVAWGDAHDRAVAVVQLLGGEGRDAQRVLDGPGQSGGALQEGAWEVPEGVEKKVVGEGAELVGDKLRGAQVSIQRRLHVASVPSSSNEFLLGSRRC